MKEKINHQRPEFTKTFHWFFCDIVSSAHPSVHTKGQLEKIQKFYEIVSKSPIMAKKDQNRIVVPTGDGYVVGFSDSVEKPVILATELLGEVTKYNQAKKGKEKLFLRVGIESGPVYVIKDLVTKKNAFWGPGIIMTKRVMDIGKENHILASKRIAQDLMKLSKEYKSLFHSIGEYEIKHGEKIEIYNIYGDGFGNSKFPRKGKETKKPLTEKEQRTENQFKFKKIGIILKVTNPKTKMTQHIWDWDLVNISGKTVDQMVYQIEGDTDKEFSDLKVKVRGKNNRKLEIVRMDENNPRKKEIYVKLIPPVKPRHEIKDLKFYYEWEEKDRKYFFVPATDCKKFYFKLQVPNEINPKVRVFKKVGLSEWLPLEPKIKFGKKNTEVFWEGENVHAHDQYKFQW